MHPDLNGRVLVHADATTSHVTEQPEVTESSDLSWHGQMTSVIAAGDGFSSAGRYRGIASASSLVLVKISSPRGQVKERDIGRGLRWLLDTYRRFNVRVVNLSVGGDDYSADPDHPLHWAVRRLTEAGIVVVAAAGNHGRDWLVPLPAPPKPLSSAATTTTTALTAPAGRATTATGALPTMARPAPTSSLLPPGSPRPSCPARSSNAKPTGSVHSLETESERALKRLLMRGYGDLGLPSERAQHPNSSLYDMLQARINSHKLIDAHHQHVDGTSVSAAIVSSVVAQMLEANPRLTPAEIRAILIATAHPIDAVPLPQQGAGAVDPARAVHAALKDAS